MSTVETTITSTLQDAARVLRLVTDLAGAHRVPPAAVSDMCVALDEVLSNIIKYAYTDADIHEIGIRLTVADGVIAAEVDDDGRPFDPLSVPTPDLDRPLSERTVGGLGIHFVRNIMSEVSYSRAAGRNRLVLKKTFERLT